MMSTFVWQVWQVEGWLYSADCALNQGGAGSPQVGVGGGPPKPSFSGSISTNNQNGPDLQTVITIIMTMTLTITMIRREMCKIEESLLRGAFKSNFWKNLGIWPN